jgi:hypothetical protein
VQLARGEFNVAVIAELPELFRSTRVLEKDLVDVDGLEVTVTESVDRLGYVRDEKGELRFVVVRHRRTGLQTI